MKRARVADDSLSDDDDLETGKPGKGKQDQRKEWNRRNARRSRQRKKQWIDAVVSRAVRLERERNLLQHVVKSLKSAHVAMQYGDVVTPSAQMIGPTTLPYAPVSATATKPAQAGLPKVSSLNDNRSPTSQLLAFLGASGSLEAMVRALQPEDVDLLLFLVRSGAPCMLTDADRNGMVWVSPAFYALTGYTPAESLGKNPRMLQRDTDDHSGARAAIRQALADQVDVRVVISNYRKDGTQFASEMHITPLCNAAGSAVMYSGVFADVTAANPKLGRVEERSTLPKRPVPGRPRRSDKTEEEFSSDMAGAGRPMAGSDLPSTPSAEPAPSPEEDGKDAALLLAALSNPGVAAPTDISPTAAMAPMSMPPYAAVVLPPAMAAAPPAAGGVPPPLASVAMNFLPPGAPHAPHPQQFYILPQGGMMAVPPQGAPPGVMYAPAMHPSMFYPPPGFHPPPSSSS